MKAEPRHMRKFDEVRMRSRDQQLKLLFVAVILLFGAVRLVHTGGWGLAVPCVLFCVLSLWLARRFARRISGLVYTEGQLVPAMVVQLEPLELLALADMTDVRALHRDGNPHWAYKRFWVRKLPLHKLQVGELVPCVASFRGGNNGVFTDFRPRPLAWATSDMVAVKRNIVRIDQQEWLWLKQLTAVTTRIGDGTVPVTLAEEGIPLQSFRLDPIGFSHPIHWRVKGEEIAEGAVYIECDEEVPDANGTLLIATVSGDGNAEGLLQEELHRLREQPWYSELEEVGRSTVNIRGYMAQCCAYRVPIQGELFHGRIYTFAAGGGTVLLTMQDSTDQFDEKYAFVMDSLQVYDRAPAGR